MKYLFSPLCLLLLATGTHAQEVAAPFPGVNVLVVHSPDPAGVALQKLVWLFVMEGYALDKLDLSLASLTTKAQSVGEITPATFTYTAVARNETGGSALHLQGQYAVQAGGRTFSEGVYWTKSNSTHAKQGFLSIESVALAYPGGRVTYLLKP